jgi:hypothetical protein
VLFNSGQCRIRSVPSSTDEETSDVLREQVAVRRLIKSLPNALLDEPAATAAAETGPQIVLPHV